MTKEQEDKLAYGLSLLIVTSAGTLSQPAEFAALQKWAHEMQDALAAVPEEKALTNREHGHLERLRERRDILTARVKDATHRAHYVIDWERDLRAVEWVLGRLDPASMNIGGDSK